MYRETEGKREGSNLNVSVQVDSRSTPDGYLGVLLVIRVWKVAMTDQTDTGTSRTA